MSLLDVFFGIQLGFFIMIALVTVVIFIILVIRRINSKGNEDFTERDN